MKIADSSGKWYVNKGVYPFVDSESGTRFEPGEKTKATPTSWMAVQIEAKVFEEVADPMAPAAKPEPELVAKPAKK